MEIGRTTTISISEVARRNPSTSLSLLAGHIRFIPQGNRFWGVDKYQVFPLHVSLLCKLIRSEAAQVFYGENEFRFAKQLRHLSLTAWARNIGDFNAGWLQTVTICTPFIGKKIKYHFAIRWLNCTCEYHLEHYGWTKSLPRKSQFQFHEKFNALVGFLMEAPSLQRLNLVLPWDWQYSARLDKIRAEYGPGSMANEPIWTALEKLLCAKRSLVVTVIRLWYDESDLWENELNHERHIKKLRQRLGIWNSQMQRVDDAWCYRGRYAYWEMPPSIREGHLEDVLLDLRFLFTDETWYEVERAGYEDGSRWLKTAQG